MTASRNLSALWATVISAISLSGIWVCLFAGVPKVIALHFDMHEPVPILPAPFSWVFSHSDLAISLFWLGTILAGAAAILALFPVFPPAWRTAGRNLSIALSLLLAAAAAILNLSVLGGAHEAYFAQARRTKVLSTVLDEFTLREAAENRIAEVEARMARLQGLKLQPVASIEQLSRADRRLRMAQLLRLVSESSSADTKKRALATFHLFRSDLSKDTQNEKAVLAAALSLTGETFSDSKAFFAWLDQHLGKDGWEPVPLYTFTVDPLPR